VEPSLSRAGRTTSLRLAPAPGARLGRDSADAVVAMLALMIRGLAPAAALVGVALRRERPPGAPEHERVLGVPVRFGAPADALDLATAALDGPLVGSPEVLAALEPIAARRLAVMAGPAFTGRVRVALRRALLEDGELPSLDRLARSLGVGTRTLQVRLREEGNGFRAVAGAVRQELAEELLRAPDASLSEIAFTLGFGDQSAFTNAFRRWAGTTPGRFRAERPAPSRAASPRSRGSARAGARSARRRPGLARR
jgi:AraC-like DNA-binding protein